MTIDYPKLYEPPQNLVEFFTVGFVGFNGFPGQWPLFSLGNFKPPFTGEKVRSVSSGREYYDYELLWKVFTISEQHERYDSTKSPPNRLLRVLDPWDYSDKFIVI